MRATGCATATRGHRRSPAAAGRTRRRRAPLQSPPAATSDALARPDRAASREATTVSQRSTAATLAANVPRSAAALSSRIGLELTHGWLHRDLQHLLQCEPPYPSHDNDPARDTAAAHALVSERETASTIVTDLPGPLSSGPSRNRRPVATRRQRRRRREPSELHGRTPADEKPRERAARWPNDLAKERHELAFGNAVRQLHRDVPTMCCSMMCDDNDRTPAEP